MDWKPSVAKMTRRVRALCDSLEQRFAAEADGHRSLDEELAESYACMQRGEAAKEFVRSKFYDIFLEHVERIADNEHNSFVGNRTSGDEYRGFRRAVNQIANYPEFLIRDAKDAKNRYDTLTEHRRRYGATRVGDTEAKRA